jgi:23S rRNA (guanosine2251-2'-O)-methyltransferase
MKRTVVGIHSAHEALKVNPGSVTEIWLRSDFKKVQDLNFFAQWAEKNRVKVHAREEGALSKIAASHQGVAIFMKDSPTLDLEDFDAENPEKVIIMALDEITDPHNIGAILRSAWLMGVKALMVPELRSGHLTPAVIKVASGGAEHVPLIVVKNLVQDLKHLKDKGFWIFGLAGEGRSTLLNTRIHEKIVWVVGNEEKGIRSSVRGVCDELVQIPQSSRDASFNASVASSIALYETVRQHSLMTD